MLALSAEGSLAALTPEIHETGWNISPSTLHKIKRYYILNAFLGEDRPHLCTTQVMTVSQLVEGSLREGDLDGEARVELARVLSGGEKRMPNTVRFNENDALPADVD